MSKFSENEKESSEIQAPIDLGEIINQIYNPAPQINTSSPSFKPSQSQAQSEQDSQEFESASVNVGQYEQHPY